MSRLLLDFLRIFLEFFHFRGFSASVAQDNLCKSMNNKGIWSIYPKWTGLHARPPSVRTEGKFCKDDGIRQAPISR